MMISKVAVVGGSGNLGKVVVQQLVDAGFDVTVVSRESSSKSTAADLLPGSLSVTTKKADYASVDSLREALAGQDAVVSTVGTFAVGSQDKLVDAAVAAGVKRFVPSEFGVNTRDLADSPGLGSMLGTKVKIVDYLQQKAAENASFTWTGICNGMFFDVGLAAGFLGFDAKNRAATVCDSGNEPFQASNLAFIGRAVAAALKQPEASANRYLAVASFHPTQNEILALAEEISGGPAWTVKHESGVDMRRTGEEKLAKGDFSSFSELLRVHLYADGQGHPIRAGGDFDGNSLLGLRDDDLRQTVKEWLVKAGAAA